MEKFNVGDKVVFTDQKAHEKMPLCCPPVGTIGKIVGYDDVCLVIQWPYGTTSLDDRWWADHTCVKLAQSEPTRPETICGDKLVPPKILRSGRATIVFWPDGTKTIVKRAKDEPDNDYAAFTAALGIKIFGSNSALRRTIKRKTTVQTKK